MFPLPEDDALPEEMPLDFLAEWQDPESAPPVFEAPDAGATEHPEATILRRALLRRLGLVEPEDGEDAGDADLLVEAILRSDEEVLPVEIRAILFANEDGETPA
jgi:hypothetical protein